MKSMSRAILLTAGLLGLAALAGCKKKDAPAGDSSTVSTTPAFRVTDVDLGRSIGADKRVSDKTDHFARTDTIYASVTSEGSAPSKALSARWTFEDGQVVDEQSQTITPSGSATTEFHIMKPTAWPVGKYKVEILVDGVSVQTKEFEVK
jgi:hypothetical protein